MKNYGFVKAAAAVPHVSVADCSYNIKQIEGLMRKAAEKGVQIISFPELCITSYTCLDLFHKQTLLEAAEEALHKLVQDTAELDIFTVVGLPLVTGNCLINAAVAFQSGNILGVVPKTYLPNYKEYQEKRWFTSAFDLLDNAITLKGKSYPLSNNLLFTDGKVTIGIEICEDLWVPVPPSSLLAMAGANIILNPSASNELIGKHRYRRSLVSQQSARCIAGYVYAMAGYGESTTDLVFAGGGIIAENGSILEESERFSMEEQLVISEIDIENLQNDRQVDGSFMHGAGQLLPKDILKIPVALANAESFELTRTIDSHPFVPSGEALKERCEEILNIQVAGLAKRVSHIHAKTAIIGISGGLDSTLALLVTVLTFDALKIPRKQILGITMPGFGTTNRTYTNAINLMKSLGITSREISIVKATEQHFKDIGHDPSIHDVTYENSQARERTQILMDIANQENGLVIGTGDLSELALGWATYNGDHMSMYGVNTSIPKTLVRYLVEWTAHNKMDKESKETLLDIADTPISPELIPADKEGNITQKTEDLVGPYELHDFFIYHYLRFGSTPEKILYLAQKAFAGKYEQETIKKWLNTFFRRFFSQQFKRSCLPDGPKVGSVSLSPRGDWRMPSDASSSHWL
ncbi:NAD+ synthase (glutamine-hydrolyzing) [Parabacteroides sp. PF5-5]|uniref:NAD(+) synthase n=1 Tax=unclassified Parabacteroides TaxID=2649774 RepID=UPI0024757189|nr:MULTISPECIES: NAD(+) synthase [unclassified Parabacteroides]MDH6303843.1 NAD+ synthase (glutamine-hydrolyzing) [Parabacteroides sp. PH5-39]MDH6314460.1 NAD+ synthase (glutamine-hydrolyzing) [Parabacteroides sp. PF5-13]MDH6318475.1 NAD+ synthase (glutamine-hydrolyzing) [Parabacteroides sp. PH5-13]MDH6322232.1 NAD+ synthase (glutamine-hydrolyzing) [Parabacteroides sp. PH5-8]MDH6325688.1 NAD+ synthase (glutamine-hydrolyzing) [Parabacteroides sp. PH5-41]